MPPTHKGGAVCHWGVCMKQHMAAVLQLWWLCCIYLCTPVGWGGYSDSSPGLLDLKLTWLVKEGDFLSRAVRRRLSSSLPGNVITIPCYMTIGTLQ